MATPLLSSCTARLSALLAAPALSNVLAHLQKVTQPPHELAGQLAGVLSMLDVHLAGVWAAAMHAVCLHAACTQLAVLSVAAFVAFLKDGFGSGEAEDGGDGGGDAGAGDGAPSGLLACIPSSFLHCVHPYLVLTLRRGGAVAVGEF